jgi:hypothetical protein
MDVRRALLPPALAWLATDAGHLLDHIRQDRDLPAEVTAVGLIGYVATALLFVLILRRHRLAGGYAAFFGLSALAGFVAVHLAPHWAPVSDPYGDIATDALNWLLVVLPMAAAAWLAVAGWRARSADDAEHEGGDDRQQRQQDAGSDRRLGLPMN